MTVKKSAYLTGATGFMGSHLAERLIREGWTVRALVRPTSDTALLRSLGAQLVEGDLADDPDTLRAGIDGATHVFHCAAYVDDWASREEMVRINVDGMRHLLDAVKGLPIERFVFMGSLVVYGMDDQDDLDESSPFQHTGDNYNYTKILCEQMLAEVVKNDDLPAVTLRPPYIYGPRDRQFFPRLCRTLQDGTFVYLSRGEIPFTLVWVDNLVDACLLAAQRPDVEGEAFIITDGRSITRRELVELLCEELGYAKPTRSAPRRIARLAVPVFEALARLKGATEAPRLNRFRYKFMATKLTYDITRARQRLGYEPRDDTLEALRRTARWFREHHPEFRGDGKKA